MLGSTSVGGCTFKYTNWPRSWSKVSRERDDGVSGAALLDEEGEAKLLTAGLPSLLAPAATCSRALDRALGVVAFTSAPDKSLPVSLEESASRLTVPSPSTELLRDRAVKDRVRRVEREGGDVGPVLL